MMIFLTGISIILLIIFGVCLYKIIKCLNNIVNDILEVIEENKLKE